MLEMALNLTFLNNNRENRKLTSILPHIYLTFLNNIREKEKPSRAQVEQWFNIIPLRRSESEVDPLALVTLPLQDPAIGNEPPTWHIGLRRSSRSSQSNGARSGPLGAMAQACCTEGEPPRNRSSENCADGWRSRTPEG
ncbi:hypothetical protein NL676_039858 [Syzygium grande]|nr:hypothetical protein NL676_039858 [Syzygium grande]